MAQPHLYYDSRELWLHPPSSKDHRFESGTIKRAFDFYRGGGTSFEDAATEYEEYEEGYGDGEEEDEMMVQLVGEEGEEGAAGGKSRKKARRLSSQQVKALEMAFDANNKLEAERKVVLASKVGLEPRQVAVWFQNRRARWKTKQMEGDFTALKTRFQSLKAERDALFKDKQLLEDQVARLKNQSGSKKQQVAEETHMNVEEACMNNNNMNNIAVANKLKDDLDLHISNTRLSYSDDDNNDNDNDDKEESSISIAIASPKKRMVSFNSAALETAQYHLSQIPASVDSDSGSSRPASSIHFRYIKGEEEGGLCEETRYPFSLFEW